MTISLTMIRLAFTAALLLPVYRETGPWTVAALVLVTFAIEIQSALLRVVIRASKEIKIKLGEARGGIDTK